MRRGATKYAPRRADDRRSVRTCVRTRRLLTVRSHNTLNPRVHGHKRQTAEGPRTRAPSSDDSYSTLCCMLDLLVSNMFTSHLLPDSRPSGEYLQLHLTRNSRGGACGRRPGRSQIRYMYRHAAQRATILNLIMTTTTALHSAQSSYYWPPRKRLPALGRAVPRDEESV